MTMSINTNARSSYDSQWALNQVSASVSGLTKLSRNVFSFVSNETQNSLCKRLSALQSRVSAITPQVVFDFSSEAKRDIQWVFNPLPVNKPEGADNSEGMLRSETSVEGGLSVERKQEEVQLGYSHQEAHRCAQRIALTAMAFFFWGSSPESQGIMIVSALAGFAMDKFSSDK